MFDKASKASPVFENVIFAQVDNIYDTTAFLYYFGIISHPKVFKLSHFVSCVKYSYLRICKGKYFILPIAVFLDDWSFINIDLYCKLLQKIL